MGFLREEKETDFGFSELALYIFLLPNHCMKSWGSDYCWSLVLENIRSSATHFIHLFITWVMPDAGDPEMNKAQGSQSKQGESVSENVIYGLGWLPEHELGGLRGRVILSVERHQVRRWHWLSRTPSCTALLSLLPPTSLPQRKKEKCLSLSRIRLFATLTLTDPTVEYILPGSSVHGIAGKNTGMGCHSFL